MDLNWFLTILAGIQWGYILTLWSGLLLIGQVRYGLMAGIVHYFCTVIKRESWIRYRVQPPFIKKEQIRSEIKWSIVTGIIISTMDLFVIISNSFDLTQLYSNISDYGTSYFIFSVIIMILFHDAYFYWTHRLLHWKPLYRRIHKIHHNSVSTSAFTSFNFHPIEAFIQFAYIPITMFTMPVHWLSLTIFLSYMTIFNILWHNSYEFWPKDHVRNKWMNIFSTPTHHNIHHKKVNYNYALYLTYWDRLMGTMHPEYEKIYDSVKERASSSAVIFTDPYNDTVL